MINYINEKFKKNPSIRKQLLKFIETEDISIPECDHFYYLVNLPKVQSMKLVYSQYHSFTEIYSLLKTLDNEQRNIFYFFSLEDLKNFGEKHQIKYTFNSDSILFEVDNFYQMFQFGFKEWCICRHEKFFLDYTKNEAKQFVLFEYLNEQIIIESFTVSKYGHLVHSQKPTIFFKNKKHYFLYNELSKNLFSKEFFENYHNRIGDRQEERATPLIENLIIGDLFFENDTLKLFYMDFHEETTINNGFVMEFQNNQYIISLTCEFKSHQIQLSCTQTISDQFNFGNLFLIPNHIVNEHNLLEFFNKFFKERKNQKLLKKQKYALKLLNYQKINITHKINTRIFEYLSLSFLIACSLIGTVFFFYVLFEDKTNTSIMSSFFILSVVLFSSLSEKNHCNYLEKTYSFSGTYLKLAIQLEKLKRENNLIFYFLLSNILLCTTLYFIG